MRVLKDIDYAERPGGPLALDLFLPDGAATGAVVFAHGGGFFKGHRGRGALPAQFAQRLTDAGLAMASVGYRLATPAEAFDEEERWAIHRNRRRALRQGAQLAKRLLGPAFEAARQDIGDAVGFLHQNHIRYGIETPRVAVLGVSAGGIAGIALAHPPSNLAPCPKPDLVVALGAALAHPWALDPQGPPVLMIHSHFDRIIAPANATAAAMAAERADAPLSVMTCRRKGHNAPIAALLNDETPDGARYWDHFMERLTRAGLLSPLPSGA